MLDILARRLPGFSADFCREADQLLSHRLPTPATHAALKAIRDQVEIAGCLMQQAVQPQPRGPKASGHPPSEEM
jgi:hypothetical protein